MRSLRLGQFLLAASTLGLAAISWHSRMRFVRLRSGSNDGAANCGGGGQDAITLYIGAMILPVVQKAPNLHNFLRAFIISHDIINHKVLYIDTIIRISPIFQ